jgi:hypothetical protein
VVASVTFGEPMGPAMNRLLLLPAIEMVRPAAALVAKAAASSSAV